MTWQALNAINRNYGNPSIDYERFAAQYDAEDEQGILHQLVSQFDHNGLIIKTNQSELGQQPTNPSTGAVERMAKHATKNSFK